MRNFVAKNMNRINKNSVHRTKKDYDRKNVSVNINDFFDIKKNQSKVINVDGYCDLQYINDKWYLVEYRISYKSNDPYREKPIKTNSFYQYDGWWIFDSKSLSKKDLKQYFYLME